MLDKRYLKRVGLYAAGTVLAIAAACYIGYHLWQSVSREIETMPAIPETYSVKAEYDAWVFRDEATISSSASGVCVPSVREGEKVAKGDAVASVYSSVPSEKLAELQTVRSQIRLLEGQRISSSGGDLGISEVMLSLGSSVKNRNLSAAAEIASRLTALASARSSGGGDAASVIASLETKKQEITASLGVPEGTVYTPESGWYYSSADGYETVFTPDAAAGISPDRLEALLNTAPSDVSSAAGRIVRTYRWYAAANMDASDAASFSEGDTVKVQLSGIGSPLELTVESAVSGAGNRTAVVFSCGIIPESFDIGRHLELELELEEINGFGIPKEAVRILDGVTGVYTFNGVMVNFRKIEIAAEYDDIYIAAVQDDAPSAETAETEETDTSETSSDPAGGGTGRKEYYWLSANELIIVKGKGLYNGKIIG